MTTATARAAGGVRHRWLERETTDPQPPVSIDDLAAAYVEQDHGGFAGRRRPFEEEHGQIVEYHFVPGTRTGAVLVRRPHGLGPVRGSYQVMVAHDRSLPRALADQIATVLHEAHRLAGRVHGRARDIVVHDTYWLVVYLLAGPGAGRRDESALTAKAKLVQRELGDLRRFVNAAARRTALWFYLTGLTLGAAVGIGLIVSAYHSTTVDLLVGGRVTVAACLAGGVIGAVISVMVRVTRGTTLEVDSTRGRAVLLLAGSFRPVIGAVFGAVLLVLIYGGLLPFQVPPGGRGGIAGIDGDVCFFLGLAFLAGFSERWAQDTIVSSAPKVPPAQRSDSDTF